MISAQLIQKISQQQLIDESTILREYFQLVFLKYFYQHSPDAYFKGGTAIRLLFNSFRYSEDLDFTCLKHIDYVNLISQIVPKIEAETATIIKFIKEKNVDEAGERFRIVFQPSEIIRQPLGIKLDFSYREIPLDPQTSVLATTYPIAPPPLVRHYSQTEILSEKIRAMFTRNKARDLFDLWFLLKQKTPINWDFVIEKMKYYPLVKFDHNQLIKTINQYNPNQFKQDLNQFLPQNYRQLYPQIIRETVSWLAS